MSKRGKCSPSFTWQVVQEDASGAVGLTALAKKYQVHHSTILSWRRNALCGSVTDESKELKAKDRDIRELRELVGKLVQELEFVKKGASFRRFGTNGTSSVLSGPAIAPREGGVN